MSWAGPGLRVRGTRCSAASRDAWVLGAVALAWRPAVCRDGIYHGHEHGIHHGHGHGILHGHGIQHSHGCWHLPWAQARHQSWPRAWHGHGHYTSHGHPPPSHTCHRCLLPGLPPALTVGLFRGHHGPQTLKLNHLSMAEEGHFKLMTIPKPGAEPGAQGCCWAGGRGALASTPGTGPPQRCGWAAAADGQRG